jgi:molybdopterin/thiamine biosynthesis adenylyltransferase
MEGVSTMLYTVTFLGEQYNLLQNHLFKDENEQAAYLLCSLSQTDNEARLLVNEVIPVEAAHIENNSPMGIHYTYKSYVPVIRKARDSNQCFILVHCHPKGEAKYSEIDDLNEPELLEYAYKRIDDKIHGSLLFTNHKTFIGRIYLPHGGEFKRVSKLRIVGNRFELIHPIDATDTTINTEILDRNIRAFGTDLQTTLQDINIGVVGCGGTGTAVVEELCRLGVGRITLVDNGDFEDTNITRMHGSSLSDIGIPKVYIMERMFNDIGLGKQIIPIYEKLDNKETVMKLRDCDLIFCCLDFTHYSRSILNQLCLYYYIPLIDMGIAFDSRDGLMYDILGRIDVVTPNQSCLFCRGVINPSMVAAEVMDTEEYARLKAEGYAPELKDDNVQAIPYNTLIASYAVIEMIQLLTNFKGKTAYHTVFMFIRNKFLSEGITGAKLKKSCYCNSSEVLGRGDVEPFLYLTWKE